MVISTAPRLCAGTPRPRPQSPAPNPGPGDHVQLGRVASEVGAGALLGGALGYAGMQVGGTVGMLVGMELSGPSTGLGGLFLNTMRGAAWGSLAGAALYGAVGVAAGAAGAAWLYDHAR